MTTTLTKLDKDTKDKLSSLKEHVSLDTLVQGLKTREMTDKLLLVILDSSDSMSMLMENFPKIEVSWKIFKSQLMPNMNSWTYGVMKFGEEVEWIVMPCNDTKALVSQGTPSTFGGTSMGKALRFAWNWTKSNANQARFIMLTDGCANDTSTENILEMAKQNSSIPIDTIGIGQGSFAYNPEFLRKLSAITGGVFCEASSIKMLTDVIRQLSPTQRPLLGTVNKD